MAYQRVGRPCLQIDLQGLQRLGAQQMPDGNAPPPPAQYAVRGGCREAILKHPPVKRFRHSASRIRQNPQETLRKGDLSLDRKSSAPPRPSANGPATVAFAVEFARSPKRSQSARVNRHRVDAGGDGCYLSRMGCSNSRKTNSNHRKFIMNRLALAILTLALAVAVANAQTSAPAPEAAPAHEASPAAKQTGKELRAQCRADAKAQGLRGTTRRAAIEDCVAKSRPDLAEAQKCRQEGRAKGLAGPALKAFVKQCRVAAQ